MPTADQFMDWVTDVSLGDWVKVVGILAAGIWTVWLFYYSILLRRRAEKIPSLEGSTSTPEICSFGDKRVAVSLRWNWRNAGTRPFHVDDERTCVSIYRLEGEIGNFIDPRQHKAMLAPLKVGSHYPLKGYGFYVLEPGTTSSTLTVSILPVGEAFIARHRLYAKKKAHPTGHKWQYSWERWQVFRTDLPSRTETRTHT